MALPTHCKYVIIGAGIHGLSTAWNLAKELKARGKGDGSDIAILDKSGIASGASGIACGVIRNNYFQPAMRKLMAHSVDVWDSDPEAFSYHPVGYMQISSEVMREDVGTIYEQQKEIGYESEFIEGAKDANDYMKSYFDDWQAQGITSVLHEKRGGYANNTKSMYGLAKKAEAEGVTIHSGVKVTDLKLDASGSSVEAVETDKGTIGCDYVVVGGGPWAPHFWDMLELPTQITLKQLDGTVHNNVPMWTYFCLQEGTVAMDPDAFKTNDGNFPPVLHVDTDAPLYSDMDGGLINEDGEMWGIYYKPDFGFGGIQGGTSPYKVEKPYDQVKVDPYGTESKEYVVTDAFVDMWTSALAHCHKRFEGCHKQYKREPSGGLGAFTPDSFPVFDTFRDNCYFIADANHGYKMIGVGALVAQEICGQESELLKPFRFDRYEKGELHPTSHSPFPWS
ncbi:NAD(P)/FAD-dependent oxidoreductase [Thiohalorhabdus sp. Cl-TMA]|uniref:NAD(P)/FAD-dependent oxidoreductase n=1 Tax=Thiohalorhabdus methylotrophus TaxID=3242694 RepID=A0ABV4TXD9_9GAMM